MGGRFRGEFLTLREPVPRMFPRSQKRIKDNFGKGCRGMFRLPNVDEHECHLMLVFLFLNPRYRLAYLCGCLTIDRFSFTFFLGVFSFRRFSEVRHMSIFARRLWIVFVRANSMVVEILCMNHL